MSSSSSPFVGPLSSRREDMPPLQLMRLMVGMERPHHHYHHEEDLIQLAVGMPNPDTFPFVRVALQLAGGADIVLKVLPPLILFISEACILSPVLPQKLD